MVTIITLWLSQSSQIKQKTILICNWKQEKNCHILLKSAVLMSDRPSIHADLHLIPSFVPVIVSIATTVLCHWNINICHSVALTEPIDPAAFLGRTVSTIINLSNQEVQFICLSVYVSSTSLPAFRNPIVGFSCMYPDECFSLLLYFVLGSKINWVYNSFWDHKVRNHWLSKACKYLLLIWIFSLVQSSY